MSERLRALLEEAKSKHAVLADEGCGPGHGGGDDDEDEDDDDEGDMEECLSQMQAALQSAKRIVESGQPPRMDLFVAAMAEALEGVCRSTGRTDLTPLLRQLAVDAVEPFEASMAEYVSVQTESGVVDGTGWLTESEPTPAPAAVPRPAASVPPATHKTTSRIAALLQRP